MAELVLHPQLDVSKRIIAVLVPNPEDEEGNPPAQAYSLQEVMYNPKIVAHSVQEAMEGAKVAYLLTAKSKAT